jgi:dimethylaniline monooxygenase (N-oxide forming)
MNMVKEGKLIHVHRASVSALAHHTVELSDGQVLPCNAAVFATGWKMNQISVFDGCTTQDIGFPLPLEQEPSDQAKHWDTMDRNSTLQINALFPILARPPPEVIEYDEKHSHRATTTPFRLFRDIVPPKLVARGDRSLIVLGIVANTRVPILAEVSSLWGIAYLENLPFSPATSRLLSDLDGMEESISLLESWSLLRFRDKSAVHLDGAEFIQDIIDVLMKDLGLRTDRKRLEAERKGIWGWFGWGAWVREWFSPYRGSDYRGLVEEYKRTWGYNRGGVDFK